MPRMTRAAARANQIDPQAVFIATLLRTPQKIREPLGKVTGNAAQKSQHADTQTLKGDCTENGQDDKPATADIDSSQYRTYSPDTDQPDVIDADRCSIGNSTDKEKCDLLQKEDVGTVPDVLEDPRSPSPRTPRPEVPTDKFSTRMQALKLNPGLHISVTPTKPNPGAEYAKEDSFERSIESRTPLVNMAVQPRAFDQDPGFQGSRESISLGAGLGNVPGKPLPLVILIEDSVEAMDAVEDAMEEVNRSLPSVTPKPSTKKVTSNRKALRCDVASTKASLPRAAAAQITTTTGSILKSSGAIAHPRSQIGNPTLAQKSTQRRSASIPQRKPSSEYYSDETVRAEIPRKPNVEYHKSVKRVSSLQKPPFRPIRSKKPTTRPSFELPGDAIARKLKERREERSAQQESLTFGGNEKIPPRRVSHASPVVKMTATAKARLSLARGESIRQPGTIPSQSMVPSKKTDVKAACGALNPGNKPPEKAAPSVFSRRIPSQSKVLCIKPSEAADRSALQATSGPQTNRGKAIFERARLLVEEREMARKKKEDTAKKAREDAKESGRQASREWAAKQRLKKLVIESRASPTPLEVATLSLALAK